MPLTDLLTRPGALVVFNRDISIMFDSLDVSKAGGEVVTSKKAAKVDSHECQMRFESLFEEEIVGILNWLDIPDLIRFERVNKNWLRLAQSSFLTVKKITEEDVENFAGKPSFDAVRLLNRCSTIKTLDFSILLPQFNGMFYPRCNMTYSKQLAWRCPLIEDLGCFDHVVIDWLLNYVEALNGQSAIKRLCLNYDLRRDGMLIDSLIKDFEQKLDRIIKGCPKLVELQFVLMCRHLASQEVFEVFGNLISNRIKLIKTLIVREEACYAIFPRLTTESHPGLKSLAIYPPQSYFLEPDLAEGLVNYAPNLEELVVRANFNILNGLVECRNLKRFEIVCSTMHGWTSAAVENTLEFFLRYRGKQLKELAIGLRGSPGLDATNLFRTYCCNLEHLRMAGLTLNLTKMEPLTKLRQFEFMVKDDLKTSDLEVLFASNPNLRKVLIISDSTSLIARLRAYLVKTAIRREKNFPKLRVDLQG